MKTLYVTIIFVLSSLIFSDGVFAIPVNKQEVQEQGPLSKADFAVNINGQGLALGQRWDETSGPQLGQSLSDDFVGEVEFDGENYKFYHHQYDGFDIYTSNLWWDKADRDFDDYIVSQISFKSSAIKTRRGAFTGMAVAEIKSLYGEGQHLQDNDGEAIFYLRGNKRLSFDVVGDKVSAITLSFDN